LPLYDRYVSAVCIDDRMAGRVLLCWVAVVAVLGGGWARQTPCRTTLQLDLTANNASVSATTYLTSLKVGLHPGWTGAARVSMDNTPILLPFDFSASSQQPAVSQIDDGDVVFMCTRSRQTLVSNAEVATAVVPWAVLLRLVGEPVAWVPSMPLMVAGDHVWPLMAADLPSGDLCAGPAAFACATPFACGVRASWGSDRIPVTVFFDPEVVGFRVSANLGWPLDDGPVVLHGPAVPSVSVDRRKTVTASNGVTRPAVVVVPLLPASTVVVGLLYRDGPGLAVAWDGTRACGRVMHGFHFWTDEHTNPTTLVALTLVVVLGILSWSVQNRLSAARRHMGIYAGLAVMSFSAMLVDATARAAGDRVWRMVYLSVPATYAHAVIIMGLVVVFSNVAVICFIAASPRRARRWLQLPPPARPPDVYGDAAVVDTVGQEFKSALFLTTLQLLAVAADLNVTMLWQLAVAIYTVAHAATRCQVQPVPLRMLQAILSVMVAATIGVHPTLLQVPPLRA
jgi:hypothetical protein